MSDYPVTAAGSKDESYDKWRAESDLRSLTEAEQIKKDPVRMKHVRRCAREKMAEMKAMEAYAKGAG